MLSFHQFTEQVKKSKKFSEEWIGCALIALPPSYEEVKKYLEKKGVEINKEQYKKVCKKMHKET